MHKARRSGLILALILGALTCSSGLLKLNAQQPGPKAPDGSAQPPDCGTAAQASERTPAAYRLDFSLSEMEDGKKLNSRQYSADLNSPDSNEIKIATRVPFEPRQGEFEYLDVGTTIDSTLRERRGETELQVRSNVTSFRQPDASHSSRPILRELKINGSTILVAGEPMLIGTADDPDSNHQFQLQVTATRLR